MEGSKLVAQIAHPRGKSAPPFLIQTTIQPTIHDGDAECARNDAVGFESLNRAPKTVVDAKSLETVILPISVKTSSR